MELELDVRNAIRQCAIGIICEEAYAVKNNVRIAGSVVLAEEAITNLVMLILVARDGDKRHNRTAARDAAPEGHRRHLKKLHGYIEDHGIIHCLCGLEFRSSSAKENYLAHERHVKETE